jgi:hypothetical protein
MAGAPAAGWSPSPSPLPSPSPSPAELAAILAAVELCWPRPVVLATVPEPESSPLTWRFSGRWWSRPVAARRDRP